MWGFEQTPGPGPRHIKLQPNVAQQNTQQMLQSFLFCDVAGLFILIKESLKYINVESCVASTISQSLTSVTACFFLFLLTWPIQCLVLQASSFHQWRRFSVGELWCWLSC